MSLLGAKRSRRLPAQKTPADPAVQLSRAVAPCPPIDPAARSCCCPSEPVAQVVLPAQSGRPREEILLCAHHLRASSGRLRALGVPVYDRAGLPLDNPDATFTAVH
ncbi:conserved hypothetical protein [Frankia sp. Hr75.2]|nr:conserved hypothetical protein [Frankia sp. Hr75.2]